MAIQRENRFSINDVFDCATYLLEGTEDDDFRRGVIALVANLVIPEVENDQLAGWIMNLALVSSYGA